MVFLYALAAQTRHFTMPWWIGAILVGLVFLIAQKKHGRVLEIIAVDLFTE